MKSLRRLAVLAALLGFAVGCSSSGGSGGSIDPTEAVFVELADLLRTGTKPPTKIQELAQHESMFPKAYQAVKSGEVAVLWGTPMMDEGDAASGKAGMLVAHEKTASSAGGWVLMTNGQVKKVSSGEFESLPKGGKK